MQWLRDFLMLFFPSNCLVCGKRLFAPWAILCFECEINMPKTGFVDSYKNPVSEIFWGRAPVRAGTSLFRFEKGSAYQTLLHDLKYRGNRKAGLYLGRLLGQELKDTVFSECDLIIPVPLHRSRLRQRGFNQSEIIARGASEITGIPVHSYLLGRKKRSRSQTTMSRQGRFENMATAFTLGKCTQDLHGKKILIIDDVITTGAALEACSQMLFSESSCMIYVATVSCA
jgi:ComF family protein